MKKEEQRGHRSFKVKNCLNCRLTVSRRGLWNVELRPLFFPFFSPLLSIPSSVPNSLSLSHTFLSINLFSLFLLLDTTKNNLAAFFLPRTLYCASLGSFVSTDTDATSWMFFHLPSFAFYPLTYENQYRWRFLY